MKLILVHRIRRLLESLIYFMLKMMGPRMTMWSLYCTFAHVWSETNKLDDKTQVTAWGKVCNHLGAASELLEELEVTEGWGLRSHPFVVDEGGQSSSAGGIPITAGRTTCQEWVKTTDKFPLL